MGGESAGGGIVIALAAVLWLVYLMPTWMRRREYLATERNAVRLQQTLRILAETAEVPNEVRVETTAHSVAEQHRALQKAAQRAESAARAREAAAARSLSRKARTPREPKQKAAAVSALTASRLRRSRLLGSMGLAASVAALGFGVPEAITTGSWLLLVAGALGALGSLAFLQRVATVAAARRATQAVDRTIAVSAPVQSFDDWERSEPSRPTWTPTPLPKPLYLSRPVADKVDEEPQLARIKLDESLRQAAAKAEEALRAAQSAPEVAQLDIPAWREASRVAAMAALDEATPGILDLNDVLARRRAV